jgi:hypothetical protein
MAIEAGVDALRHFLGHERRGDGRGQRDALLCRAWHLTCAAAVEMGDTLVYKHVALLERLRLAPIDGVVQEIKS